MKFEDTKLYSKVMPFNHAHIDRNDIMDEVVKDFVSGDVFKEFAVVSITKLPHKLVLADEAYELFNCRDDIKSYAEEHHPDLYEQVSAAVSNYVDIFLVREDIIESEYGVRLYDADSQLNVIKAREGTLKRRIYDMMSRYVDVSIEEVMGMTGCSYNTAANYMTQYRKEIL